jgi:hypothetical protein
MNAVQAAFLLKKKELNLNVDAIINLQKENDELKNNAYSKVAPSELNKNAILEKNKVIFV